MIRVPTAPIGGPLDLAGAALRTLRRRPIAIRAYCETWLLITWAVPLAALGEVLSPALSAASVTDANGVEWGLLSVLVTRLSRIRLATTPVPIGPGDDRADWFVGCTLPASEGGPEEPVSGVQWIASSRSNPLAGLSTARTARPRRGRVRLEQEGDTLDLAVTTDGSRGNLEATFRLDRAALPGDSVFSGSAAARTPVVASRYEIRGGPDGVIGLPVERGRFLPHPVGVEPRTVALFERGALAGVEHRLAAAWHAADAELTWLPGRWLMTRTGGAPSWGTTVVR